MLDISELDSGEAVALDDARGGDGEADCIEDDASESEPVTVGKNEDLGASGQTSGILSILSCIDLAVR